MERRLTRLTGIILAIALIAVLVLVALPVLAAGLFSISGANVYEGYLEDGDWLVVIEYKNTLEPYYGNETSIDAFKLQLVAADNSTLIAQVPQPAWGHKPGSIYLSNATVSVLEWGMNYTVKLNGTANETSYTLTAGDWRGSDLVMLDAWCLAVAHRMESYYNETFLAPSATATTDVLNTEGGVMFAVGIPYLEQARPNLFMIATYTPEWETTNWTGAYEESLPAWDTAVGANIAGICNDIGTVVNLDGQYVAALVLFIFYFALALGSLGTGHGIAGLVLGLPLLIAGWYFRLIPFAVLGIVVAIVALFLVRQFWWKTT